MDKELAVALILLGRRFGRRKPLDGGVLWEGLSSITRGVLATLVVFLPLIQPASHLSHPNILLIILDDANKDMALYGGQAQMANLERIAASGIVFTNAVANSTGCNPSRVSLATGLLPVNNCVHSMADLNEYGTSMTQWRQYMDECSVATQRYGQNAGTRIRTLFQTFREQGYYTLASGKVMHLNGQQWREFDQSIWTSMDHLKQRVSNAPIHGLHEYYEIGSHLSDWGTLENLVGFSGETFSEQDTSDWFTVDNFIRLLGRAPAGQPFFAAVGLVAPHVPRYVPQRLIDQYDEVQVPEVLWSDADDLPAEGRYLTVENSRQIVAAREILSDEEHWRYMLQVYYASLSFADEQIGRILEALEVAGHLGDTVIVVWSDHGYHLGQKIRIEKGTLWRESYEIPLIIKAPGYSPATVHTPVNSVDLFPTLLELAHLEPVDTIPRDGTSLTLLMRDPQTDWSNSAVSFFNGHAAIYADGHAYIQYNALSGRLQQHELYALTGDPHQWYNLAGDASKEVILQEMQSKLAPFIALWQ